MSRLPKGSRVSISCKFFCPIAKGCLILVITDLHLRFLLVEFMESTNTVAVFNQLQPLVSILSYLEAIKHNNGLPLNSSEFRDNQSPTKVT